MIYKRCNAPEAKRHNKQTNNHGEFNPTELFSHVGAHPRPSGTTLICALFSRWLTFIFETKIFVSLGFVFCVYFLHSGGGHEGVSVGTGCFNFESPAPAIFGQQYSSVQSSSVWLSSSSSYFESLPLAIIGQQYSLQSQSAASTATPSSSASPLLAQESGCCEQYSGADCHCCCHPHIDPES